MERAFFSINVAEGQSLNLEAARGLILLPNVELSGQILAAGPLQRRVGRLVDKEIPEIGLRHSAR